MTKKTCAKCNQEKPIERFIAKRTTKVCKLCDRCRDLSDARCKRYKEKNPEKLFQMQKAWKNTEKGLSYIKRQYEANKTIEKRAHLAHLARDWRKSDKGLLYQQSASLKASKRRQWDKTKTDPGAKLKSYIQVALCDAIDDRRDDFSSKIERYTEFTSNEDVKRFFSSQFEPGMSWDNHSHQGWNIGHKIAKAHYDMSNEEDVRRCWKKDNLFPQWATGPNGNCALRTKFPRYEELLNLRDCWPTNWNDVLPSPEVLLEMEQKCNIKNKSNVD